MVHVGVVRCMQSSPNFMQSFNNHVQFQFSSIKFFPYCWSFHHFVMLCRTKTFLCLDYKFGSSIVNFVAVVFLVTKTIDIADKIAVTNRNHSIMLVNHCQKQLAAIRKPKLTWCPQALPHASKFYLFKVFHWREMHYQNWMQGKQFSTCFYYIFPLLFIKPCFINLYWVVFV